MSISYTYTIVSVDETARCMEIRYEAEGRQPHHVGARLPYEGEELEAVIEMYSPVALWLSEQKNVVVPSAGLSGVIAPSSLPADSAPQNAEMWQQIEFERRVGDVLVKFNVLPTNPMNIPVATLGE